MWGPRDDGQHDSTWRREKSSGQREYRFGKDTFFLFFHCKFGGEDKWMGFDFVIEI